MIKQALLAVVLLTTSSLAQSAPKREFDPSEMSQSEMVLFADKLAQLSWMGFVRGWYESSNRSLSVSEECFGDWIVEDLHEVDDVVFWLLQGSYSMQAV